MSESDFLSPTSETMQFVQPTDSTVSTPDSLDAGTSLGHYVIKKFIGGGGMGRVYLASDTALDRDVAVKVLPRQRSSDPGFVARFMNEAKSAARLNHEHIAQVYFAGETSAGVPFIAFEYVEGINVRTMVEKHDVFSLPQALNYLLQIAHALAHAATHNVVHRDVKPSNILITREGRAKLIDMGLARLMDTSEARGDLTASGVTLGTFDYISPEQARDPRNADIRSDIYSLGCTFFFMLAGRPPFPEGTVLQKLLQHQGDAPPDIRSFQPAIPAEIAFLIQKMMAKDPKQRFQTPVVLIEALTDAARRLGLRPAGGNLVWTPARSHRISFLLRHTPWVTAVLLLFLGVFLMTLFMEQFYETFRPPEQPSRAPLSVEVVPVPSEQIKESVSFPSFVSVFVPHSTAQSPQPSAGLQLPMIGGILQPALEGAGLHHHINAQCSVAYLKSASQNSPAPRPNSLSAVRCVDPTGNTPNSYTLLSSALTDVEDGTTIELKWNLAIRIPEPIRFDRRKKIRIVAAAGHDPVLLFEPPALQNARSFFSVFSSDVEFQRVGIEIRINTSALAQHWSLFELTGNTQLTFDKCCLTVRNKSPYDDSPHHDDVVFFRNDTSASVEGANIIGDMFSEPLEIRMTNSLLRGEAVAIQSDVPQEIRIRCENSLIALAKPFLQAEESRRATKDTTIQIRWDNVAFFGRQEVINLYREQNTKPVIVDFESERSICVLNRSPFAVFRGTQAQPKMLENAFRWSGSDNYLHGVSGLRFSGTPDVSMEDWRNLWSEDMKDRTKIDMFTLNEIAKSMHQYLPRDVRTFDPTGKVSHPNFDWFPPQWNDD